MGILKGFEKTRMQKLRDEVYTRTKGQKARIQNVRNALGEGNLSAAKNDAWYSLKDSIWLYQSLTRMQEQKETEKELLRLGWTKPVVGDSETEEVGG